MKKVYWKLIIVLVVVIIVGMIIFAFTMRENDNFDADIQLSVDGVTSEKLAFTAENFLPGETREYTFTLGCAEEGDFTVSFSYESKGEGTLWQYLDIEISHGGVTKQVAFAELYAGTTLDYDVTLAKGEPASFIIRYSLPAVVGNEAQNQRADFVLLMKAERK